MSHSRDLYKTKLCSLYQRGGCPRQTCSFAHGDEELRRFPSGGRQNYRGSDLRERLDRRRSPFRRHSPTRDGGGRQGRRFSSHERGNSHSRSPARHKTSRSVSSPRSPSHKREPKRPRTTTGTPFSDVSEDAPNDDDYDGGARESHRSPTTMDTIEDKLHVTVAEIEELSSQKLQLELSLEKLAQETDILSTKNSELETKLSDAQSDYKRLGSKIKKFIKAYMRYLRNQEEVKRAQAKLQKMADELPAEEENRLAADSDANILSEGEGERQHNVMNTASNTALTNLVDSDLDNHVTRRKGGSRKRQEKPQNGTNMDIPDDANVKHNAGDAAEVSDYRNASRFHELNEKPEKDGTKYVASRPNRFRSFSDAAGRGPSFDKVKFDENHMRTQPEDPSDSKEQADLNPSSRYRMNGSDLPLDVLFSQVPSNSSVHYNKYKGEDEDVDVDGMEGDMGGNP